MRKLGLWGGVLLLALGLTAAAAAAPPPDDDDDDGSTKSKPVLGPDPAARPRDGWNPFLTRVFGGDPKKPAAKPDKDKEKEEDKKPEEPSPRAAVQFAAHYRALEDAKLRRRQDVCQRLREIARETHDDELDRKAIELDALAFEVYQSHLLRMAGMEQAEQRPPSPRPSGAKGANDSDGTDSVREVKP
jgi:hypothetical protein